MKDYRDRPKIVRMIIDLKWKLRKSTGGVKGIYFMIILIMAVFMIISLVVEPAMTPQVEHLTPTCQSVCDIAI